MIDHGTILDDDPVLTALQMDRHFFNWGHHDTYFDSAVSLEIEKFCSDLGMFDVVKFVYLLEARALFHFLSMFSDKQLTCSLLCLLHQTGRTRVG